MDTSARVPATPVVVDDPWAGLASPPHATVTAPEAAPVPAQPRAPARGIETPSRALRSCWPEARQAGRGWTIERP